MDHSPSIRQERKNALGQPIGEAVPDWKPARLPHRSAIRGTYCTIDPLGLHGHAADLFAALHEDPEQRTWTYLAQGPFETQAAFENWLTAKCLGRDPQFYAVIDHRDGRAVGMASYMRIDPAQGSIEVGSIIYGPRLQGTRAATEAMVLMMRHVFEDLGYRRYEWKCDALNAASRRAAERLGFRFEGIFRQATVYKGRNRDTAWYAILDREWPDLKRAYDAWLDPGNFDTDGRQRTHLSEAVNLRHDRR